MSRPRADSTGSLSTGKPARDSCAATRSALSATANMPTATPNPFTRGRISFVAVEVAGVLRPDAVGPGAWTAGSGELTGTAAGTTGLPGTGCGKTLADEGPDFSGAGLGAAGGESSVATGTAGEVAEEEEARTLAVSPDTTGGVTALGVGTATGSATGVEDRVAG